MRDIHEIVAESNDSPEMLAFGMETGKSPIEIVYDAVAKVVDLPPFEVIANRQEAVLESYFGSNSAYTLFEVWKPSGDYGHGDRILIDCILCTVDIAFAGAPQYRMEHIEVRFTPMIGPASEFAVSRANILRAIGYKASLYCYLKDERGTILNPSATKALYRMLKRDES